MDGCIQWIDLHEVTRTLSLTCDVQRLLHATAAAEEKGGSLFRNQALFFQVINRVFASYMERLWIETGDGKYFHAHSAVADSKGVGTGFTRAFDVKSNAASIGRRRAALYYYQPSNVDPRDFGMERDAVPLQDFVPRRVKTS